MPWEETEEKKKKYDMSTADRVSEAGLAYNIRPKQQGMFTIDDYYALPDERRVELIDGVIYDMAAPSEKHQMILVELTVQLQNFIRKNNGKCRTFAAPFDVQLDKDNRTMVQPDVLVICDRSRTNSRGLFGAPDLSIEILSPSTARKDASLKLKKYMNAGVREYWIVDPDDMLVTVHMKKGDKIETTLYSFDDQVPVGIWDNKCLIDFPDIKRQVEDWTK